MADSAAGSDASASATTSAATAAIMSASDTKSAAATKSNSSSAASASASASVEASTAAATAESSASSSSSSSSSAADAAAASSSAKDNPVPVTAAGTPDSDGLLTLLGLNGGPGTSSASSASSSSSSSAPQPNYPSYDGGVYIGAMVDGRPHGRGKLRFTYGHEVSGEWKNGELPIGTLTIVPLQPNNPNAAAGANNQIIGDSLHYEGELMQYVRHGKGMEWRLEDGEVNRWGRWENNVLMAECPVPRAVITEGAFIAQEDMSSKYEFIMADGTAARYEGTRNAAGEPHGTGTMFNIRGEAVRGDNWVDGAQDGEGYFVHVDGERYNGFFKHGFKHGAGSHLFPDGELYEGSFRHNRKHGIGKQRWDDGYIYEGQWAHDEQNGWGIEYTKSGKISACGRWKDSELKEWHAVPRSVIPVGTYLNEKAKSADLLYSDGGYYKGEVNAQHEAHGKGILYTASNSIVQGGLFQHGKLHGEGFTNHPDGGKYSGEHRAGLREGLGKLSLANGDKYIGAFHNNLQHGRGVYQWAKGDIYDGYWSDVRMHGIGKYCLAADHEVLTQNRGWVSIKDVIAGVDSVWALDGLGWYHNDQPKIPTASWHPVVQVKHRPLDEGEKLYLLQSESVSMLCDARHEHPLINGGQWLRKSTVKSDADPSDNSTACLSLDRDDKFLLSSAIDSSKMHSWPINQLSFLPATINSDLIQQSAWCRFLGYFLRCGSLEDERVLISASQQQVDEYLLADILRPLGWSEDSISDHAEYPRFIKTEDGYAARWCALRDFLSPLAEHTSNRNSVALPPIELVQFLSPMQARWVLSGYVLADVQLSSYTGGTALTFSTSSPTVRDDLMTLCILAGLPCQITECNSNSKVVVDHHEASVDKLVTWTLSTSTSVPRIGTGETEGCTGSFQSFDECRVISQKEHQQDTVYCLSVPTAANFITRLGGSKIGHSRTVYTCNSWPDGIVYLGEWVLGLQTGLGFKWSGLGTRPQFGRWLDNKLIQSLWVSPAVLAKMPGWTVEEFQAELEGKWAEMARQSAIQTAKSLSRSNNQALIAAQKKAAATGNVNAANNLNANGTTAATSTSTSPSTSSNSSSSTSSSSSSSTSSSSNAVTCSCTCKTKVCTCGCGCDKCAASRHRSSNPQSTVPGLCPTHHITPIVAADEWNTEVYDLIVKMRGAMDPSALFYSKTGTSTK